MSPDELEEKARLITQVLELQNTLDGKYVLCRKLHCIVKNESSFNFSKYSVFFQIYLNVWIV